MKRFQIPTLWGFIFCLALFAAPARAQDCPLCGTGMNIVRGMAGPDADVDDMFMEIPIAGPALSGIIYRQPELAGLGTTTTFHLIDDDTGEEQEFDGLMFQGEDKEALFASQFMRRMFSFFSRGTARAPTYDEFMIFDTFLHFEDNSPDDIVVIEHRQFTLLLCVVDGRVMYMDTPDEYTYLSAAPDPEYGRPLHPTDIVGMDSEMPIQDLFEELGEDAVTAFVNVLSDVARAYFRYRDVDGFNLLVEVSLYLNGDFAVGLGTVPPPDDALRALLDPFVHIVNDMPAPAPVNRDVVFYVGLQVNRGSRELPLD